jgi:tRNA threonylcarbamoyl adenosine modification protein YeaZ
MKMLAFDTCFDACSAAVSRGDGSPVVAARQLMRRGHAEALMPMIDRVMNEAGLAFGELDRFAVTNGPGTFTGTRLGIAASLGLSLVNATPVATASSLAVIARFAAVALGDRLAGSDGIAVIRDARRDRVYFEVTDTAGRPLEGPRLATLDEAIAALEGRDLFAFGSGVAVLAARAGRPLRSIQACWPTSPFEGVEEPDARYLVDLAPGLEASLDPAPLYLRPPDAKPAPAAILGALGPAATPGDV